MPSKLTNSSWKWIEIVKLRVFVVYQTSHVLTNPWLMKYSSKNIAESGIMYLNSDGTKRILSKVPQSFCVISFWSPIDWLHWHSKSCFGILFGDRSKIQNAVATITGTTSIISMVSVGVKPSEISAAYEKDPRIPAPPVPDAYVEITFLQNQIRLRLTIQRTLCFNKQFTYEI